MKHSMFKRCLTSMVGIACAAVLVGGVSSCTDDMHKLLTGQPSWLGQSIYEELEANGNYKTTLALINSSTLADQSYKETLSRTGSRTVFVADDEAWQRFFDNNRNLPDGNPWKNATSFENLTPSQIRLLFKSNIITNAYLISLLSNKESTDDNGTVTEGMYMRRASGIAVMDSVPVIKKDDYFPIIPIRTLAGMQIDYWADVRSEDSIIVFQDNTPAPMVHFTPSFMNNNDFTPTDVDVLTNHQVQNVDVASINGVTVREQDITCQNGYIHILNEVPQPVKNMAQILEDNPDKFSIFSRLINRFSYPYKLEPDDELAQNYNKIYNPGGEPKDVYVKRYFNNYNVNNLNKTKGAHSYAVANTLPYDPGWNRYYLYSAGGAYTFQDNMAAIFAPNDRTMVEYLVNGSGRALYDKFCAEHAGEVSDPKEFWDWLPDENVLPFLENCMQKSFLSAIPTKVKNVNNTSSEPLGVEIDNIKTSYIGCNGVVYEIDNMIKTPDYSSVFAPLLINSTSNLSLQFNLINTDNMTVGAQGYKAYLNNMAKGTALSYIALSNTALDKIIDVCTLKRNPSVASEKGPRLYSYYYDNENVCVRATPFYYTVDENGEITKGNEISLTNAQKNSFSPVYVFDKDKGDPVWLASDMYANMKDLMDNTICTSLFKPGQKFYKTKGGGPLIVDWSGDIVSGIAGSMQYNQNRYIPIQDFQDYTLVSGNGHTYTVDEAPQSTTLSPWMALAQNHDFKEFFELVNGSSVVSTSDGSGHVTLDSCITLLKNFNYTIYVPSNEVIQSLQESHVLPTWSDVSDVRECLDKHLGDMTEEDSHYLEEAEGKLTAAIDTFIYSHFQDNAVYVFGEPIEGNNYETAFLNRNTLKFATVNVSYTPSGDANTPGVMTVTDRRGVKNTVLTDGDNYNILTRQYYFNGSKIKEVTKINTSSYATIHAIDNYLLPGSVEDLLFSPQEYKKIMDLVEYYNNLGDN